MEVMLRPSRPMVRPTGRRPPPIRPTPRLDLQAAAGGRPFGAGCPQPNAAWLSSQGNLRIQRRRRANLCTSLESARPLAGRTASALDAPRPALPTVCEQAPRFLTPRLNAKPSGARDLGRAKPPCLFAHALHTGRSTRHTPVNLSGSTFATESANGADGATWTTSIHHIHLAKDIVRESMSEVSHYNQQSVRYACTPCKRRGKSMCTSSSASTSNTLSEVRSQNSAGCKARKKHRCNAEG